MDIPSSKRPRAPSGSSSASLITSPGSSDPPHKASRIVVSSASSYDTSSSTLTSDPAVQGSSEGLPANPRPLLCNLPPTCHRHPTPLANTNELERHYATYHAHVCASPNCGCVFTEARLLELHQTECHDPIAAVRKERGEKIFQCHLPAPACGRNFLTPKARRLHLIQSHGYPKEYFFAVTNKGIGGLLKKWGEGASMIRKEWKPRPQTVNMKGLRGEDRDKMDQDEDEDDGDEEDEEEDEDEDANDEDEKDEEMGYEIDESNEDDGSADLEATPRMLPRTTGIHSPQSSISSLKSNTRRARHHNQHRANKHTDADNAGVAGLTDSLNSLSLVPNSIRFGRGKTGGFAPNQRGARGRARGGSGGPHAGSTRGTDANHHRGTGHRGGARGGGGGAATSSAGTVDLPPPTAWAQRERGRGRGRQVPRGIWGRGRGF